MKPKGRRFKIQRIIERRIDRTLGWVEVLECGHIRRMTANDKRSFPMLGKFGSTYTASRRECYDCRREEA